MWPRRLERISPYRQFTTFYGYELAAHRASHHAIPSLYLPPPPLAMAVYCCSTNGRRGLEEKQIGFRHSGRSPPADSGHKRQLADATKAGAVKSGENDRFGARNRSLIGRDIRQPQMRASYLSFTVRDKLHGRRLRTSDGTLPRMTRNGAVAIPIKYNYNKSC